MLSESYPPLFSVPSVIPAPHEANLLYMINIEMWGAVGWKTYVLSILIQLSMNAGRGLEA
jgi:hypothetical protein